MIRERLLVRGVERDRVTVRIEGDDAQAGGPFGGGRRRVQLDAHLAEHPHGDVPERLEQGTGPPASASRTALWNLRAPRRAASRSSPVAIMVPIPRRTASGCTYP